ncbi:MAG TPA: YciI family protein [Paracoccaceae bacterium]|nr:YciI family protein [Paracoccaceae bacterium]
MPHFAAIGFDHPPHSMALRDRLRAEHRRYVLENDARILMAGAMRDAEGNQCGTIYVFAAESPEEVWQWLGSEPFHAGGVYASMQVVAWSPALNRFGPVEW